MCQIPICPSYHHQDSSSFKMITVNSSQFFRVLITYHGVCNDLYRGSLQLHRPEVHTADAREIARWIGELRSQQLAPDGVTFNTVMQARKPRIGWLPIGSMYAIYANMWGIWMVNVTIYGIHGSYGLWLVFCSLFGRWEGNHR